MGFATQGSTVSIGGTPETDLLNIGFSENGNEIDVTSIGDAQRLFEAGTPDIEVTLEVNGDATPSIGSIGTIVITWNDGGSDTLIDALCTVREASGAEGDKRTTTVTFKRASTSV